MLKKTLGLLAGMIASASAVSAQTYYGTHSRNFDHWYSTDGYWGNGQRMGDFYNWQDSNGFGFGERIGNTWRFHYNRLWED